MSEVRAVVSVAVEFDANYEITETKIKERVTVALKGSGLKVNDVEIERYIVTYGEGSVEVV